MADLERIEAAQRFMFTMLNGQIETLSSSLYRTRCDLLALAAIIARKGIEIDPDEWEAAGREVEIIHQVEKAFDPRMAKGEDFMRRLLAGEEIPDEEMNQWLRDVEGGDK